MFQVFRSHFFKIWNVVSVLFITKRFTLTLPKSDFKTWCNTAYVCSYRRKKGNPLQLIKDRIIARNCLQIRTDWHRLRKPTKAETACHNVYAFILCPPAMFSMGVVLNDWLSLKQRTALFLPVRYKQLFCLSVVSEHFRLQA